MPHETRRAKHRRSRFSIARAYAIMLKEFVQMRRDRLTFAMIVGIPILQLVLFGYAINTDPKNLPTAVVDYDRSDLTRPLARENRMCPAVASPPPPMGSAAASPPPSGLSSTRSSSRRTGPLSAR